MPAPTYGSRRGASRSASARPIESNLSFATNGFELRHHTSDVAWQANTETAGGDLTTLRDAYHDEMTRFIAELSGSTRVVAQATGFFVRHGKTSSVKTATGPARMAHCDFTHETASAMAARIANDVGITAFEAFAVYQTWRAVFRRHRTVFSRSATGARSGTRIATS